MGTERDTAGGVSAIAEKPARLKRKQKALGVQSSGAPVDGTDSILWLQRSVGNYAVGDLLSPSRSQGALHASIAIGTSEPLPTNLAERFSTAFNHDLADVRIETASLEARRLGARAFTLGRHVTFAPGEFQTGTTEGLRLLAHELAHVVQQSNGARGIRVSADEGFAESEAERAADQALVARSVVALSGFRPDAAAPQRAPSKTIDWTHGVVEEQYDAERKRVLLFNGQTWLTVKWNPGGSAKINVEPFLYSGGIVRVSVHSDAWLEVTVDATAEEAILTAHRDKLAAGAEYEFICHGTIKVVGRATGLPGATTLSPPVRRVVGESVDDDTIVFPREGEITTPKPSVGRKRLEGWSTINVKDSFPTFATTAELQKFLKLNPYQATAVVQMADGRLLARPIDEVQLQKIANAVRNSVYRPPEVAALERIQWYQNQFGVGEFQAIVVNGVQYNTLDELRNLFYENPDSAAEGAAGDLAECEVFRMGNAFGVISYGRKPLNHAQALARLKALDASKANPIGTLETEPGRRFESLRVRGVGAMHVLDSGYFLDRDIFWSWIGERDKLSESDRTTKLTTLTFPPGVKDFYLVEIDREQDNPDVIAALKRNPNVLGIFQSLVYQGVLDRAQAIASKLLEDTVTSLDKLATSDEQMSSIVRSFPGMVPQRQSDVLEFLGIKGSDEDRFVRHVNTLRNVGLAFQIANGNEVNGINLASLRASAQRSRDEVAKFLALLRTTGQGGLWEHPALQMDGPFGDSIRTLVYKERGFALDPKKYPHRDTSSEWFPSALSGTRGKFASTQEQLYANAAHDQANVERVVTLLKGLAIAAGVAVLVAALNVAGVAIATYFGYAAGTTGFFLITTGVTAAGLTLVDVGFALANGQKLSVGDIAEMGLWNLAGAGLFGRLGFALRNANFLLRGGAMFATGLGLALVRAGAEGKLPKSRVEWEDFFINNIGTFIIMEAVGTLARPFVNDAYLWGSAKRLGLNADLISSLMSETNNLSRDLSSYASKPDALVVDAPVLKARAAKLLAQQRKLVAVLAESLKNKVDLDLLNKAVAEELAFIDNAAKALDLDVLKDLGIRRVGESASVYSYKKIAGAATRIRDLFPGSVVDEAPDGTITLTIGAQDPILFVPEGAAAPAPVGAKATVNVNTASVEELAKVPGIGKATAEKIVSAREMEPFKSVDDAAKLIRSDLRAKALPLLTAAAPPSLTELQAQLRGRLGNVRLRLGRIGATALLESLEGVKPGESTNAKTLGEDEAKIAAAENQLKTLGEAALRNVKARTGIGKAGMDRLRAGGLSDMTDQMVADALLQIAPPDNNAGLGTRTMFGVEELRGVLWAFKRGIDLQKFFAIAVGKGTAERNFVLDSYGKMADANMSGIDKVIGDMGSKGGLKWDGGIWAIELARYGFGLENIDAFEVTLRGEGERRDYDIILKNGVKIECKNWGSWDAELGDSLADQFRRDLKIGGMRPELFKNYRYIFRFPGPTTIVEIRARLRTEIAKAVAEWRMDKSFSADDEKKLYAAFDSESDLVTISTVRAKGAVNTQPTTLDVKELITPRTATPDKKDEPTVVVPVPVLP